MLDLHLRWRPGDPCPHCRRGPVTVSPIQPMCLYCGRDVDDRTPILEEPDGEQ